MYVWALDKLCMGVTVKCIIYLALIGHIMQATRLIG